MIETWCVQTPQCSTLKANPFVANDLTHFVDDKIDALTSIRAACWTQNRFAPTLHLAPTQWANGTSLNFEHCCSAAARTGSDVHWSIFPTRSLWGCAALARGLTGAEQGGTFKTAKKMIDVFLS